MQSFATSTRRRVEITRVRRLERGVGQTLAGAVGRVEVLQHGQAFLEVRQDRRLDDRAVGTRHQAAHAGELLHLLRRTAGAGMAHHVDGVHLQRRGPFRDRSSARRFPSSFRPRPGRCTSTRRRRRGCTSPCRWSGRPGIAARTRAPGGASRRSASPSCPARPCRPCRTRCRPCRLRGSPAPITASANSTVSFWPQ